VTLWFVLFEAATQLARQVHQERTQVVCSNKVDQSRLALRHSRLGFVSAISIIDFFLVVESRHTASVPSTSGTHTGGVQ